MPRSLKIYIVDDAMELCQELWEWLSQAGHDVTCSPALRLMTQTLAMHQPDLIIIGMARYAGAGMAVFKKLGNHRQLRQVPKIVVSDDASLEYEMLDVFDFQVRPLDRERLAVSLKRLAGRRNGPPLVAVAGPELTRFKDYLLEHSGLHFNQHNHRILERGLMRRIQALQMVSLSDYFEYLTETPHNYDEMNKLLGLLTVGETSFFRYRTDREALVGYVLPRLLDANRARRKLRIWSAGCSTGEEPYSFAMLLLENFPEVLDWDVQILATDINKRSLRLARDGVYGERSLRMMEGSLRERYFDKVGHHYLLKMQVRRMVRFEYLNLLAAPFPGAGPDAGDIDLLSCRNVLIYFNLETIRQIVDRFSQSLSPEGYLFLGHAETMQNVSDRFLRHHQHNAFFYQLKRPAAKGGAVDPRPVSRAQLRPPASPAEPEKARRAPVRIAPLVVTDRPEEKPKVVRRDTETLYREAMAAFERERFAESDQLFDELLQAQPDNPQALVGKGLLLANQGRYGDARIYCARAIKENDLLPEAYLLRGLVLDMEGFHERALVEYQKVLWLEPAFVMAHYLSARAYGRLKDDDKRQRSLRNTVRALERAGDQVLIPFSGGLSRGVFLDIVRKELRETPRN